jgi:ATP-binding cassette subfamily B protein
VGLGPLLRGRSGHLSEERIAHLREVARKRMTRSLAAAAGTSGLTVASLGVLGYLYVDGRMSLASLGAAVAGLLQLSGRLRGVADGAGALYESALFVDDYEAFLDLAPQLPAVSSDGDALPPFDHLTGVGLTFTYPGSADPAVEDVSVELRAGEIVALVGENGSGKTTLAKLLAHLYRPTGGRILWDGVDTASLDPARVRRSIAVIFQDFVRYLLPARENIGAGRHERFSDNDAIVAAATWAGADSFISRLPQGYDTTLGKEFTGGSDLSIGQWQRVALARAFFRDAPFVILDEPTAALDPRAEYELFNSIRALFHGRAVLLISHRFSSVRSADRIYVLDRGRLVEQGTHAELMAQGGMYAELFALQASAYLDPAAGAGDGHSY